MRVGDFVTMRHCRTVFDHGWADYKAPKGHRFVFAVLGLTKDDGSEPFDGEAALNRLGWFFRDSGSDRNGEDPAKTGAECEASQSGPKGIAQKGPQS